MGRIVLSCNPSREIVVRRNSRARRMSLRVSRLDGRVTLTLPTGVGDSEGQAFLDSRSDWVNGALAETLGSVSVDAGSVLPFEGAALTVAIGDEARVCRVSDRLILPRAAGPEALKRWFVAQARERALERLAACEETLGLTHKRLSLRDTRSRWGSCSSTGTIMLSWRLIMAPKEVLAYVVAHEAAHLREMNHSPAFWDVVASLMPDYKDAKGWLRAHGHELHRYRFD